MNKSIAAFFVCATLLCIREALLLPDGKLHVHMLDVGQGDSYLVVTPSGKQILIDGGPSLATLSHLGAHMPFFDRTIEMVILTHPDADHLTALPAVLSRYTVENILLSGAVHTSGRYEHLLNVITTKQIAVIQADPAKDIIIDDVTLDVVWPPNSTFGSTPSSQNNYSVVVRMLYDDYSMLFTGDIEEEAERDIVASGADIDADVMTVPHHGSQTSSSTGFLLAVSPDLALLSAGKHNRYGHPHPRITARYKALGIPIKTTLLAGTVSIER